MISLKKRLILTYAVFICIFALTLSFTLNHFSSILFSDFVKENIEAQSEKIAESIADQYIPKYKSFNMATTLALGMSYVHQGYIISIEDTENYILWDARACDMEECVAVIREIEMRMKGVHQVSGEFEQAALPLTHDGELVGHLNIETYRPYFYSESESEFMRSLNVFIIGIGVLFSALSVFVSGIFAAALSKPILKAAHTARMMADSNLTVRMTDDQRTSELYELSHAVNDLATALENGERWQKRLTGDIAHELRTPLTTLQGNIEAMIDGVWAPTPQRLTSCHEEIVRLNKLVEDLGFLSILEQETLHIHREPFDIGRLLRGIVDQLSPRAAEKSIRLTIDAESVLYSGDSDRLKQVFFNLISNAIQYTDEGSVHVSMGNLSGDLEIAVADTGCGISKGDIPHVFERFFRADKSRTRVTGGAGIGLTIVNTIVQAHGGTISIQSELGKGSTFYILLPKS